MKILAMDTATKSCSVALLEDETLQMEITCNLGLTHSQTAMAQVAHLFQSTNQQQTPDLLAVTVGPGSFTGLRIAISGMKGLCVEQEIPCAPISTLAALAAGCIGFDPQKDLLLPALDARQGRAFAALFAPGEEFAPIRLEEDQTVRPEEWLPTFLEKYPGKRICLLGDGAPLCFATAERLGIEATTLPKKFWAPSGYVVGRLGLQLAKAGKLISPEELLPFYPEEPKAKRELEQTLRNQ